MHAASGDVAVARIAAAQRRLVTTEQLTAAGLGRGAVAHRVAHARLHRMHRGVYLVGPGPADPLTHAIAAVLASGAGASLSHRSAAAHVWGLPIPCDRDVDVTIVGHARRQRRGVRLHRVPFLAAVDLRPRHGIAVTAPARTILDLSAVLPAAELERVVAEAYVRRLVTRRELAAAVERAPRRRGTRLLRALLDDERDPGFTRSEAERRLVALVRAAALPAPETNVRIDRYEVDAVWRAERLVVEVDGYAFHASRTAFEHDRRKDADLQDPGYRVLRITWRQLTREPHAVVARLARALARR